MVDGLKCDLPVPELVQTCVPHIGGKSFRSIRPEHCHGRHHLISVRMHVPDAPVFLLNRTAEHVLVYRVRGKAGEVFRGIP